MPEFVISWSPYGPSGRLWAESQAGATQEVVRVLRQLGLETEITEHAAFDGQAIILRSPVKRYGDMASFAVCVYPVGGPSFYDAAREQDLAQKSQPEAS